MKHRSRFRAATPVSIAGRSGLTDRGKTMAPVPGATRRSTPDPAPCTAGDVERRYESRDGLSLCYRDYDDGGEGWPLLCIPGLSRNSRDFHRLALALRPARRVLAVDLRGRGLSDYDPDGDNYRLPTYVADIAGLMRHAGIDRAVVLGTSLGGVVAMMLASEQPAKVAGLVLNDIGPEIARAGLARIREQAGRFGPVWSWDEACAQTREIHGHALPDLDDARWMEYTRAAYREGPDGVPRLDLDPRIGERPARPGDLPDPWTMFSSLSMPTLVLRGEHSDILTRETAERMQAQTPELELATVAGRGHAPLLDESDSLAALEAFLARADAL